MSISIPEEADGVEAVFYLKYLSDAIHHDRPEDQ